jgi:hypothetical protein
MVRKLNVVDDAQADIAGHGGEQRGVFVDRMEPYRNWEQFLVSRVIDCIHIFQVRLRRELHWQSERWMPISGLPIWTSERAGDGN